jgi:hypothetical protein
MIWLRLVFSKGLWLLILARGFSKTSPGAQRATLSLAGEGKKEKSWQLLDDLASFGFFLLKKADGRHR